MNYVSICILLIFFSRLTALSKDSSWKRVGRADSTVSFLVLMGLLHVFLYLRWCWIWVWQPNIAFIGLKYVSYGSVLSKTIMIQGHYSFSMALFSSIELIMWFLSLNPSICLLHLFIYLHVESCLHLQDQPNLIMVEWFLMYSWLYSVYKHFVEYFHIHSHQKYSSVIPFSVVSLLG